MDNTNTIFYLGFNDYDSKIESNERVSFINYKNAEKGICYCRKCKSKFYSQEAYDSDKYVFLDPTMVNIVTITCPTCGTECKLSDLKRLKTNYCIFREAFRYEDKVRINTATIAFYYYNKNLIPKIRRTMIVFNLKTGMSYGFPIYKETKVDKKIYGNPSRIYNCTYKNNMGWTSSVYCAPPYSNKTKSIEHILKEVYDYIREYNINKLDCYIPSFEENFKDYDVWYPGAFSIKRSVFTSCQLYYGHLTLFNRFPTINPVVASKLFVNPDSSYKKTIKKTRLKIKKDCKDVVKSFLEINKVPVTRITKKQTREYGIDYVFKFSILQEVFSIDNIYKIINNLNSYSIPLIVEVLKKENLDNKTKNNLCNKIKKVTENESKIRSYTLITDTFRTVERIKEKKSDYKVDWTLSLKEIHDIVNSDYNKICRPNVVINYNDDIITKLYPTLLSGEYEGLTFALAKDTHELIDVGTQMNICVGGYDKRAVDKHCYIVIVRDKNNKPFICIELDEACFRIKQAKLKFNYSLDEDLTEIVLKWCKDNLLKPDSYDLDKELADKFIDENVYALEKKSKAIKILKPTYDENNDFF